MSSGEVLWWLVPVFVGGYVLIAFEQAVRVSKSAIALVTGVACWGLLMFAMPERRSALLEALRADTADIAGIVFFLLCAMAIVETIGAHNGFLLIARWLRTRSLVQLVGSVTVVTFFLSAVIDNMTTTLVMLALLRGLLPEQPHVRRLLAGLVVIAANAGGAWSPIGDVTTTMLWLGGHVGTVDLVRRLFLPAFVTACFPALLVALLLRRSVQRVPGPLPEVEPHAGVVLAAGIGGLLSVPVVHVLTGLPPVFGAFLALALLWLLTEHLHRQLPERAHLQLQSTLRRVDVGSLLFFVGILLAVDALEAGHVLAALARWLDTVVPAKEAVVTLLGLLSAVVDNVPLTAACMNMYAAYPPNDWLWMLLAYAVGTGGSLLVIGSAAGVVAMGAEQLEFFWYALRIAPLALLGYASGIACLLGIRALGW
jgi:Na+/H+ antiporter NhaD/arsenite permease-like protein